MCRINDNISFIIETMSINMNVIMNVNMIVRVKMIVKVIIIVCVTVGVTMIVIVIVLVNMNELLTLIVTHMFDGSRYCFSGVLIM